MQVVVAPRKTNVAGLGMLFSKWSSDSQIFRAVPIMFEPPTSPGPPGPPDQVGGRGWYRVWRGGGEMCVCVWMAVGVPVCVGGGWGVW